MLGDEAICAACEDEFTPPDETRADYPGEALEYRVSAYHYAGRAGQAVRRLKYERATGLAAPMAETVTQLAHGLTYDLAIPVPIHPSRRSFRGFNQAELIAEALPCLHPEALRRVRRTRPQFELTPETRQKNLRGAFKASPSVRGQRVLLVDDVFTSGATARECASALRDAGAIEVGIATFAVG